MTRPLFLLFLAGALGACSWGIKLDAGGDKVRTAWDGKVAGCKQLGKVTVSVLDRVGPLDRNNLKVRDELEVMARNQAAGMGADTIAPIDEPHEGEQSWNAYACGAVTPRANQPVPLPKNAAETYPIQH